MATDFLSRFVAHFLVFFTINHLTVAVDKGNFKTCDQSSFCRRNRAIQPGDSPYTIVKDSLVFTDSLVEVNLLNQKTNALLSLKLTTLEKNTARFKINELKPIRPRYEVQDVLVEYPRRVSYEKVKQDDNSIHIKFGNNSVVLTYKPFRLDFLVHNEIAVSVNSRGLMNFEHYRTKGSEQQDEGEGHPPGDNPDTDTDAEKSEEEKQKEEEAKKAEEAKKEEEHKSQEGMWDESFGTHQDSKPGGPSSVGLDISFPGVENVYGIPEHADSLSLKTTTGSEPYRLYNLDVFEYELDSRMALYGSIPYMVAHSVSRTVGVFWLNVAETWIDIDSGSAKQSILNSLMSFFKGSEDTPQIDTHWVSESGIIDVFVMLGPRPHDVFKQYAALTGTTYLPPLFAIAYHQSRWNYNDEDDVKSVDSGFDEHDIPYDVLWLDIEHTDGKKYMTWDQHKFPSPDVMQNNIAAKGRKMVTIVDPHIKRENGYHIHEAATSLGFYVKNKDGGEYENHCWPGSSSWIDFTSPDIRKWWSGQFALEQYKGSTNSLFIWNDMNEPSVFHGPEITMHKDAVHHGDWEHRDVHNIFGMYLHMATAQGLIDRSEGKERPFVLSRAFFAGTQRYGPIWTGDNTAEWGHLKASLPMLLSLNVAGLPFSGADVGGFFKDPDPELLTRWYQAAAFQPFFRGHAHLDTKRREPWLYEDKYKNLIRNAIRRRYALLPYWYTLFYHASQDGTPIIRPLWVEYPEDKSTFAMEDEYIIGKDLLIKPVVTAGETSVSVYLPGKDEYWYDLEDAKIYRGENSVYVATPLQKIPLFQRGGSIVPRKERVRRCTSLTHNDPYTLTLALNSKAEAEGDLYIDDGHSFDYKSGAYVHVKFTFKGGKIVARRDKPNTHFETKAWIERITVLGISNAPNKILLTAEDGETKNLDFTHDSMKYMLVIKKPGVNAAKQWSITMHA